MKQLPRGWGMADQIAVLEDGVIKEFGSHEELLALEGTYARLFNLQAKGYQWARLAFSKVNKPATLIPKQERDHSSKHLRRYYEVE